MSARATRSPDGGQRAAFLRWRPLAPGFAVLAALAGAAGARADDVTPADAFESLIGIIEKLPESLVPQAEPEDPRRPDALFAAAIAELQQERFGEARRLFELFVVRDPKHPMVPEARRHLSELYQLDAQPTPAAVPRETAANPEPAAPPSPVARIVADARPVGGRLEDSFMLEAGDRVFFAPSSAELGSRARSVLTAQARWLKRNAGLSAVIEGHVDDPSLDADGVDRLAAARARAVFERLIEEGIAAERLAISPQGAVRPVATCRSAECAAQNRRAVTVLTVQRVSELPGAEPLIGPRRP